MSSAPTYKRVLLKLSGEGLMGPKAYGLDDATLGRIAADIKAVVAAGVQVCVVIGAGNIFRGVSGAASGMNRASADYMGMLATVINCLAMQSALERLGCAARVLPFPWIRCASRISARRLSLIWKRAGW